MALAGYNIAFKLKVGTSYLTLAGRTQDDLTIAARTKERLTKDDQGNAQVAVSGQDVTFRATGMVDMSSSTAITRNTLIGYSLQTGSSAVFEFQYATDGGGDLLSGNCVITNLSESSNASDDATLTVDFRVVGAADFSAEEQEEEPEEVTEEEPAEELPAEEEPVEELPAEEERAEEII